MRCTVCLFLLLALPLSLSAAPPIHYIVTAIDAQEVYAINDRGQVVGEFQVFNAKGQTVSGNVH